MNIERKYRKQVNTNGWERKLQKWTWGRKTPDFVGYCPFFWFTWLTLFVLPVTLVWKCLEFLFGLGLAIVVSSIPKNWVTRPSDMALVQFYEAVQEFGMEAVLEESETWEDVLPWILANPDWENCVKRIIARNERQAERRARKHPKRDASMKWVANHSGKIVVPIIVIVVAAGVYFIAPAAWKALKVIVSLILGITWANIIFAAKVAAGGVALTLIAWATVWVISRVYAGLVQCPKEPEKIGGLYKTGDAIGRVVFTALEFLVDTIETLYTRECPLIEWGDHNEPIERIEK